MADTSREPSKVGGVIVETCLLFGVMCITFFQLMSVAYLSLLEHDMDVREKSALLNGTKENENQSDILMKHLSQEKFLEIRDRMFHKDSLACATTLCIQTNEYPHIDMLNAAGPKKKEARCLDPFRVYLDTCSTFHQNINPDTVTNIHTVARGLKSHSNGGVSCTNQKANYGEFLGGLETWFQEKGLANIISFHQLEKKYPITYVHELKTFVVHTKGLNVEDGMVLFKRSPERFPYVDLCDEEAFIMVNTVRGTLKGTQRPK